MSDWILPLGLIVVMIGLIVRANSRMGKPRKDGRPNRVPWGFVMVFCAMGIFMMVVHLFNVAGFETGPEHSLLGRF